LVLTLELGIGPSKVGSKFVEFRIGPSSLGIGPD